MKRLDFLAGFLCGAVLLGGGTAYAVGVMAERGTQQVYVDGQAVQMEAYNIDGYNYVKLRDVGGLVDFNVYWDGSCVQLESGRPYTGLPSPGWEAVDAVPGDQVAVALFQAVLKNDVSSAMELFGCSSESETREALGLDEELYNEMIRTAAESFTMVGYTPSQEELDAWINAYISAFSKVEMTARLKALDVETGTAVVTCGVSTFGPYAFGAAVSEAVNEIDPSLIMSGDTDAVFSALMRSIPKKIKDLEPDGGVMNFDVRFVLSSVELGDRYWNVWVPQNAEKFGEAISTAAMGG